MAVSHLDATLLSSWDRTPRPWTQLARPAVGTILAAECLDICTVDQAHTQACVKSIGGDAEMLSFTTSVLPDSTMSWWWSDLDRENQFWIEDSPSAPADPEHFELLEELQHWYDWAQHPSWELSIDTSTAFADPDEPELPCGIATELSDLLTGDWQPSYPLRAAHVTVDPTARVYEIHQPEDWARLALAYGPTTGHRKPETQLLYGGDTSDSPAPNWPYVAKDWGGVHLSLFGFLTTMHHPVTAGGVTTQLTNWFSERTLWLRPSFSFVRETDAISIQPRSRLHPLSHA